MDKYVHFKISIIARCSPGDRVICTYSSVKGRTGKIFVVRSGIPSKKDQERGHMNKKWLESMEVYGDQFQIVDEPPKTD